MVGKNCLWGNLFISKSILCIISCLFLLLNVGYVGADTEAKLFIKYEKPLLSANIQGAKLSDVIRELKNKTGVDFNYRSLPDQIIYLSFANLSLKNGIKQTIPYGTIFVSDQNSSGEETIKSVYILTSLGLTQNKLQPVISSPIPSLETTPQKGIEYLAWQAKDAALAYQWLLQLQEEDPDKRLAAIIKLGKLGSNFFSVKGLYLALNDKDNRVRKTASEGLKRLDEQTIIKSLTEELQQIEPIIQKETTSSVIKQTFVSSDLRANAQE